MASGEGDELLETGEPDGAAFMFGGALLLLGGSLAVAIVTVRRRRV
jgi:hypothetical protein